MSLAISVGRYDPYELRQLRDQPDRVESRVVPVTSRGGLAAALPARSAELRPAAPRQAAEASACSAIPWAVTDVAVQGRLRVEVESLIPEARAAAAEGHVQGPDGKLGHSVPAS